MAVAAVRTAHPDATVTVWAEDERRIGLLPVLRRVWAPRGQRPIARVRRRYQWRYVYGFVCPSTGQSWWCLLPTVNAVAMSVALTVFARDVGVDATHRVVLVWDGAGWHTARTLVVPVGIDLIRLPPASPELQPAEHLWPLLDEPVANRAFADLAALDAVLEPRCRVLTADRATVQSTTHFHWWPEPIVQ